MNRPLPAAPPLSPLSAGSHDSYGPRYGSLGGAPSDPPYGGGSYSGQTRPPQTSPPGSNHPSSSTDMSRPSAGGSSIGGGRPASTASSVARSSDGRLGFPGQRDSARSAVNPHNEDALQKHYEALKRYLTESLHDEKGNMKPNRARDKLLRLSVTQFMELSTDVYDELMRREDERLQRMRDVPRSLPPKQTFHPKRNQARQKLSTLPIERFRQLATDVFYELERRIPRFATGDMDRPMSRGSTRAPSRGGMRPMPPPIRPPPPGMGGRPPMSPGSMITSPEPGRPIPKSLHSNTIVPNKSTLVEDDDDDMDDEDEFALDNVVTGLARRNTNVNGDSEADQDKMRALEVEIAELREKLLEREQEILKAKSSGSNDLGALREELEQKHMDAQKLNDSLRQELDQLHKDKNQDEREIRAQHDRNLEDLRAQLNNAHSQTDDLYQQLEIHQSQNEELRGQLRQGPQHTTSNSEYERRLELLQQELSNQQKLTKEVRDEATMLLREMRDLSQQNDEAIEQEERLAAQVTKLEKEIDEWRLRYARLKAQNKSLRASQMDLGLQASFDAGSLFRKEGAMSEGGLVKDIDITRYQMSVEDLLKVARQSSTDAMLDSVKNVVVCVQSITSAIGTDGYPTPSASPLNSEHGAPPPMSVAKLKARVTGTANSLITQTKLHANASGLSPVALLDAAASNLTAAVVELVKAVGIRPTPQSELEDIEVVDHRDPHESMGSFYDDHNSQSDEADHTPAAVQITAPVEKPLPSPPSLGRSNTLKKMNGWFNWGSKTPVEEAPPTPHGIVADEYDPYRSTR